MIAIMFARFSKHSIKTVIVCLYVCSLLWSASDLPAADSFQIETPPMPGQTYSPSRTVSPEDTGTPPGPGEGLNAQDRLPPEVRRIDEQIRESTRELSRGFDSGQTTAPTASDSQTESYGGRQPDEPFEPVNSGQTAPGRVQSEVRSQPDPNPDAAAEPSDTRSSTPASKPETVGGASGMEQASRNTQRESARQDRIQDDATDKHTVQASPIETEPESSSYIRTLMIRSGVLLALIGSGFLVVRKFLF
ncbi:MAG: hypothetical protein K9J81_00995 [Desulfohalobiaceae bacterium]|nr:hypothetical protein [Desulfohalobiaceae bacterium]